MKYNLYAYSWKWKKKLFFRAGTTNEPVGKEEIIHLL
jgi:hypothetical protein